MTATSQRKESTMTKEPDYTMSLIKRDDKWIVCEGGQEVSKPLDLADAAAWHDHHIKYNQPTCCGCGSAITRPDDPWEVYSTSSSDGHDWFHRSCTHEFNELTKKYSPPPLTLAEARSRLLDEDVPF